MNYTLSVKSKNKESASKKFAKAGFKPLSIEKISPYIYECTLELPFLPKLPWYINFESFTTINQKIAIGD